MRVTLFLVLSRDTRKGTQRKNYSRIIAIKFCRNSNVSDVDELPSSQHTEKECCGRILERKREQKVWGVKIFTAYMHTN